MAHIYNMFSWIRKARIKKEVYWCCWYSPVKMIFGIKGSCFRYMRKKKIVRIAGASLENSSAKLLVTWEKFNYTLQKIGIQNTEHLNWFFSVTTCILRTSKITGKGWACVLIVDDSLNFSLFSCLLSGKNSLLKLFPEVFG